MDVISAAFRAVSPPYTFKYEPDLTSVRTLVYGSVHYFKLQSYHKLNVKAKVQGTRNLFRVHEREGLA